MANSTQIKFVQSFDSSISLKEANEISNSLIDGDLSVINLPDDYVIQVCWDWKYGLITLSPFGDAGFHAINGWRFKKYLSV